MLPHAVFTFACLSAFRTMEQCSNGRAGSGKAGELEISFVQLSATAVLF
jgi:hypothetical protein